MHEKSNERVYDKFIGKIQTEREDIYTWGGNGKNSKGILGHHTGAVSGRSSDALPAATGPDVL